MARPVNAERKKPGRQRRVGLDARDKAQSPFVRWVIQRMDERNFDVIKLAAEAGLGISTIYHILDSSRPGPEPTTLQLLSKALNARVITMYALLGHLDLNSYRDIQGFGFIPEDFKDELDAMYQARDAQEQASRQAQAMPKASVT